MLEVSDCHDCRSTSIQDGVGPCVSLLQLSVHKDLEEYGRRSTMRGRVHKARGWLKVNKGRETEIKRSINTAKVEGIIGCGYTRAAKSLTK